MAEIIVQFEKVGHDRVTFQAPVKAFEPYYILRVLRKSKALPKLADVMWNLGQRGTIWLNGRTWAGRFFVVPEAEGE